MLNRQIQMSGFERSILLISELGGGGLFGLPPIPSH